MSKLGTRYFVLIHPNDTLSYRVQQECNNPNCINDHDLLCKYSHGPELLFPCKEYEWNRYILTIQRCKKDYCNRKGCTFRHIDNIDNVYVICDKLLNDCENPSCPYLHLFLKTCSFFKETGVCPNKNCYFDHTNKKNNIPCKYQSNYTNDDCQFDHSIPYSYQSSSSYSSSSSSSFTRTCKFFNYGYCVHGKKCLFKHVEQKNYDPEINFKINICFSDKKGICSYGDNCRYAHGEDELRPFKQVYGNKNNNDENHKNDENDENTSLHFDDVSYDNSSQHEEDNSSQHEEDDSLKHEEDKTSQVSTSNERSEIIIKIYEEIGDYLKTLNNEELNQFLDYIKK